MDELKAVISEEQYTFLLNWSNKSEIHGEILLVSHKFGILFAPRLTTGERTELVHMFAFLFRFLDSLKNL